MRFSIVASFAVHLRVCRPFAWAINERKRVCMRKGMPIVRLPALVRSARAGDATAFVVMIFRWKFHSQLGNAEPMILQLVHVRDERLVVNGFL